MIGTRKTDERDCGTVKVTTLQLPAMRGSRLRLKLMRMIAPLLTSLKGKSITKIEDLAKLDLADIAPSLLGLLSQLDDAAHDVLVLELLVCTSVVATDNAGKAINFDLTKMSIIDQAFGADVDALWGALRASIEVNVGGFFADRGENPSPEIPTPSS